MIERFFFFFFLYFRLHYNQGHGGKKEVQIVRIRRLLLTRFPWPDQLQNKDPKVLKCKQLLFDATDHWPYSRPYNWIWHFYLGLHYHLRTTFVNGQERPYIEGFMRNILENIVRGWLDGQQIAMVIAQGIQFRIFPAMHFHAFTHPVNYSIHMAMVDALEDLLDAMWGVGFRVELPSHNVFEQLSTGDAETVNKLGQARQNDNWKKK